MSADPERADLDARVLAWMDEAAGGDFGSDEARFAALALDLFAFQFAHCPPFRRLCEGRGRRPGDVRGWREIPPVPTGAFKELAVRSFPVERTEHVFRTSGTATRARGELHLDTLALYEASLAPTFAHYVLPDLPAGGRMPFLVLAPSRAEAPASSLSHMFHVLLEQRAAPGSGFELDLARAAQRLVDADEAICLCGTAFALLHLLETLKAPIALPAGSRIMETGGFKGRARELERGELHARLAEGLGLPAERIVNQYGMTELGSQFYDSNLRHPDEPRRKLGPPWARAIVVDPARGEEVADGETGTLVILDLANTGSVLAVRSADLGRRIGDGFDVLGREPGAEARGCSIAADEMLAASPLDP